MLHKIGTANIVLCVILLAAASPGYAEDARLHPGPWPIWHWHNHQPTQRQLDALHKSDVTPEESREIDRLYGDPNYHGSRPGVTFDAPWEPR